VDGLGAVYTGKRPDIWGQIGVQKSRKSVKSVTANIQETSEEQGSLSNVTPKLGQGPCLGNRESWSRKQSRLTLDVSEFWILRYLMAEMSHVTKAQDLKTS
jgi:hypothetical protein